jgi:hypothetical protein
MRAGPRHPALDAGHGQAAQGSRGVERGPGRDRPGGPWVHRLCQPRSGTQERHWRRPRCALGQALTARRGVGSALGQALAARRGVGSALGQALAARRGVGSALAQAFAARRRVGSAPGQAFAARREVGSAPGQAFAARCEVGSAPGQAFAARCEVGSAPGQAFAALGVTRVGIRRSWPAWGWAVPRRFRDRCRSASGVGGGRRGSRRSAA